jgi:hypothetical protein
VQAAEQAGVVRDGSLGQLCDGLIGQVVAAVRPSGPAGHGSAWQLLQAEQERITTWVGKDLTVVKIGDLLARRGVVVAYRTLHRFCVECCGFGRGGTTVRVADGQPGVECQIDFGRMGLIFDPATGRRRTVHALIFTAVYSRHMFVWLTFSQTLEAIIAGCEAAWAFFGGYACVDPTLAARAGRSWRCSPPWSADGLDAVSAPFHRAGGPGPGESRRPFGGRLSGVRGRAVSAEHGAGDGL